jgi:type IV pilus assembly protein PilN
MSTPVRINLLPHREQKRVARQRQFVSLAALLAIMSLGVVGLVHIVLSKQIDNQNSRNTLLKTEIVKLDEQIKEIDKLREQIAQVLARKQVVETLQANRNESVHLLDQLVRQLPDGVYLRSIRQAGTRVTLIGYAQSNARVSTLMRNIESSPWVASPELVEVKLVAPPPSPGGQSRPGSGERVNEFTLNVQVRRVMAPLAAVPAPVPVKPAPGVPAKAVPAVPPKPPPAKASVGGREANA